MNNVSDQFGLQKLCANVKLAAKWFNVVRSALSEIPYYDTLLSINAIRLKSKILKQRNFQLTEYCLFNKTFFRSKSI